MFERESRAQGHYCRQPSGASAGQGRRRRKGNGTPGLLLGILTTPPGRFRRGVPCYLPPSPRLLFYLRKNEKGGIRINIMSSGKITDTEQADLKKRGLWGTFLACRDKHEKAGETRNVASRRAYEECSKGDLSAAELELAPEGLADRAGSEVEIIRWVARNIDNHMPTELDCPDPFAWTLLRQCRSNPMFVTFFIEKLWVKLIPSKAQLIEPNDDGPIDGAHTLEILEKIRSFGRCPGGLDE